MGYQEPRPVCSSLTTTHYDSGTWGKGMWCWRRVARRTVTPLAQYLHEPEQSPVGPKESTPFKGQRSVTVIPLRVARGP